MILSQKIVRTRKSHVCFGCTRMFPAGTLMERSAEIDAGKVWSCYLCENCQTICYEQASAGDYDFCFGDLRQVI